VSGAATRRPSGSRSYVGLYGDHATATITLTASGPEPLRVLRTWTREQGEAVFTSGEVSSDAFGWCGCAFGSRSMA
jgi:hypothetical protein